MPRCATKKEIDEDFCALGSIVMDWSSPMKASQYNSERITCLSTAFIVELKEGKKYPEVAYNTARVTLKNVVDVCVQKLSNQRREILRGKPDTAKKQRNRKKSRQHGVRDCGNSSLLH